MKPIVVVGSINMDLVVHAERLPGAGETVHGTSFATHHGGKGANQAVAAARLGAPTILLGCVGQDSFGEQLLCGLRAANVDVHPVLQVQQPSGIAVIQVDAQGDNRITVVPGANSALSPTLLAQHDHSVARAGMVLTQLETPIETLHALAAFCREQSLPLMLDPAPAAPLERDLLAQIAWLTPNLAEAHTLLGAAAPASEFAYTPSQLETMARDLLRLGPQGVLLKLGAGGAVALVAGGKPVFAPAFPVQAVDTTAAGDATNAAFATALLQNMPLPEALRFAMGAGALAVTRRGAQPSLPTLAEVHALLQSHTG